MPQQTPLQSAFTCLLGGVLVFSPGCGRALAQAAAAPSAAAAATARQIGTVRAIGPDSLTLVTDAGQRVVIGLSLETRVLQLAPGSTDLKSAQPAALSDVVVGDRVLAAGGPGSGTQALVARRLLVMKSSAIAEKHQAEEAAWQHSTGGLVQSVDAAAAMLTLVSGTTKISVVTSPQTTFRRYAPGSARFEDAAKSTFAALEPGDQVRVRGTREGNGTIAAQEIVSGSFADVSGLITSVDPAAGTILLKDLKTKLPVTLRVTSATAVHHLPAEAASRFAGRSQQEHPDGQPSQRPPSADANEGSGAAAHGGAGRDLSQFVTRLPEEPLADLKAGQAILAVGSREAAAGQVTAITILSGVEPILAASPSGSGSEVALSPWSVGGDTAGTAAAQ